jgi:phosphate transport system substrate-binding protein
MLLFLGVVSYYFWQTVKLSTTTSNLDSSSTNSLNSSSDIQLYNSIKEVPNVPEGTFSYGGAVLFASITGSGAHKAMTGFHPNFYLVYTEPRSGKPGNSRSLTMLLNGEISFAQIALPLTDTEYSKAKERGFTLEQVPVAIDAIIVFTHPDLSIPGLSVDQLQDIYKGKITNWKQVGGPNLPIIPFARPKVATLLHVLLGPEVDQVSPKVQYIRDYTDAIRKVASTPGAISFGGSGPLIGQKSVRFIPLAKTDTKEYVQPFIDDGKQLNATAFRDGTYPMIRRLFIAIRRDGKIDEQVGVAYTNMLLSKEGQQFVEKAGFLPLR